MLRRLVAHSVVALGLVMMLAGTASAKKMLTRHAVDVYQGLGGPYRVFLGYSDEVTPDGIDLSGTATTQVGALSFPDADTIILTFILNLVREDGQTLKAVLTGPYKRSTGLFSMSGTITEASGQDLERLIGNDCWQSGKLFHPAGPYVPNATYSDSNFTVEKHDY